jgi:hypothetical protein
VRDELNRVRLDFIAGAETELHTMIEVARKQLGQGVHRDRVKLNLFAVAGQKLRRNDVDAFLASALVLLAEQPLVRTLDEIREKR